MLRLLWESTYFNFDFPVMFARVSSSYLSPGLQIAVSNEIYISHTCTAPNMVNACYNWRWKLQRIEKSCCSQDLLTKEVCAGWKLWFMIPSLAGEWCMTPLKKINGFGNVNCINSGNFKATTMKLAVKFHNPFSR